MPQNLFLHRLFFSEGGGGGGGREVMESSLQFSNEREKQEHAFSFAGPFS